MSVRDDDDGLSDHRPLKISMRMNTRPKDSWSETDHEGSWPDETRDLLDISPFSVGSDDERQALLEEYHLALADSLGPHLRHLRETQSAWDRCQARKQAGTGGHCADACPCHRPQGVVNELYSGISAGIISAAESVLERI